MKTPRKCGNSYSRPPYARLPVYLRTAATLSINSLHVRFEVFTAVTMKNAVFWDVVPCSSCVNRRSWFHARRLFYHEDGGDTFLRNVGSHNNYTTPHPRKRHSSTFYKFPHIVCACTYEATNNNRIFQFSHVIICKNDRLCGLVNRVPGYSSRGPGFDSGLSDFLKSSGSGTWFTQHREDN
jgi:hypothetical protein